MNNLMKSQSLQATMMKTKTKMKMKREKKCKNQKDSVNKKKAKKTMRKVMYPKFK